MYCYTQNKDLGRTVSILAPRGGKENDIHRLTWSGLGLAFGIEDKVTICNKVP